jgi:hypothetical protein
VNDPSWTTLIVGLLSCLATIVAVVFGIRRTEAKRAAADAAEGTRMLAAARALAGKGDETRRAAEAVTEVAREREAAILRDAAKEAHRDPVDRANEIIRVARADAGAGDRDPALPAGAPSPRRVP